MPKFSIVIPVYNTEAFLKECIESIIKQTYQKWELILIDDGSTDYSSRIIDEYSRCFPNIRGIHKENEGVALARRLGCDIASGDYILFIDSDDWIEENSLELLHKIAVDLSPDIIKFGLIKHLSDGSVSKNPVAYRGMFNKKEIQDTIFPFLIQDNRAHCFGTSLCGGAFKREKIVPYMIADREAVFSEDCASFIPSVFHSDTIYFIEECLYHYRFNQNSATKSKKVFSFMNPYVVAEHIRNNIEIRENDFQLQLNRKIAHDLFTVCASQFYRNEKANVIRKDIKKNLHSPYYRKALKQTHFAGNIKASVMLMALRYDLLFLIQLYSMIK